MSRYDRESGRYTRNKTSRGSRMPGFVVGGLMLAAAVLGFSLRPVVDEAMPPIKHLLSLGAAPQSQLTRPAAAETKTAAREAIETMPLVTPPAAPVILPTLDTSDSEFRKALTNIAPALAPWLGGEGLIRRSVAVANDFTQGQRLAKNLGFLKPAQPFAAQANGNGWLLTAQSQKRYDALAHAIGELDSHAVITVFQTFKPLFVQAYSELGYPDDKSFSALLSEAGQQILAAPIIEGAIPLTKTPLRYKFQDPQLEALNPLSKQMLRMGPENTRLIQNKTQELLEQLAASEATTNSLP